MTVGVQNVSETLVKNLFSYHKVYFYCKIC